MNTRNKLFCGAAAFLALAAFFLSTCALTTSEMEKIVHARTPSIITQPGARQFKTGDDVALTIVAEAPDGGELSYQWYAIADSKEYDSQGGTLLNCEIETLTLDRNELEENTVYRYYVVVTNTKSSVTGLKRVSVQSEMAFVVITDPDCAAYPFIGRQPQGGVWIKKRGMTITLSLSAALAAGARGDVVIQWYLADDFTNEYGTPLEGVTGSSFSPGNLDVGVYYYFAAVTNTDMTAAGRKTTTVVSEVARVSVELDPDAEMPEIETHPRGKIYFFNDTIAGIAASVYPVEDGGTLSYQWHSNTVNENSGGTPIEGATDLTLKLTGLVANNTASINYFYLVVSNTNEAAVRTKTVTVASNVAMVIVQTDEMPASLATATVNFNDRRQWVRGFGGMDVAWGNFPTYSIQDYETMYNPNRLGYNMLRVMIMPTYTDVNKTMEELVANKLAGAQDRSNFYEFARIVNRYGGYVLASPWTPPAAWKSNNSVNGGGELRHQNYRDMAKYLDAFARNMYNNGAPIYAITLQNEPTYTAGYDGCEYTAQQNRDFFMLNKRFITTPGYGGGRSIPQVYQVGGESHNEIVWQNDLLRTWESRDYADFVCRHIYGASASRYPLAIDPANKPAGVAWVPPSQQPAANGSDAKEVWMTEHNLNSNNATAYVNDSTWNYVWKFMNDVDFVIRLNDESAFVWWSSKRFYSMIGDGQYGTVDGVVYPRGYGLSHYAKFAKETGRVGVTLAGLDAGLNDFTYNNASFDVDSRAVKITAYVKPKMDLSNLQTIDPVNGRGRAADDSWIMRKNSLTINDIAEITLVMWTPTNVNGAQGTNMGTIKINLPDGFEISHAEAMRSTRAFYHRMEAVTIGTDRQSAYVDLPASNILSVRFTNAN